ncbi:hypothetical protein DXZ75_11940 [Streptomyces sp. AcE210]|nr:hypothetical protein DXZ75_11940 [Streptomyces sp. AcE210]
MRAVCRSIAAHTISCSGWSALLGVEDSARPHTVPPGEEDDTKRPPGVPGGLVRQLSRLDSNQ